METTNTSTESARNQNPLTDFASAMIKAKGESIFSPADIRAFADTQSVDRKDVYKYILKSTFRASRGMYDLTEVANGKMHKGGSSKSKIKAAPKIGAGLESPPAAVVEQDAPIVESATSRALKLHTHDITEEATYVPDEDPTYVRWGSFKDALKIIQSEQFFPVYIAGPSGNGKTFMVEQAVAKAGRKFIRVQLTPETDEDDLLGGFRLVDGNTVFCKGPVIRAMQEGSVLLLDEIDRATNKIMCLQSVLEGKSVLLKKTGETIYPKAGFQVIATANTRGRGCDDGRYTAASIIDDAFLERFPITMNQTWASRSIERKIVLAHMKKFDCMDEDFAEKLVTWSQIIHKTYEKDGIDDEISTRRICHAVQTYSIFKDRMDAVRLVCNRFDDDVAASFLDLYTKVDSGAITPDDDSGDSADYIQF